jgi:hypothetical protein
MRIRSIHLFPFLLSIVLTVFPDTVHAIDHFDLSTWSLDLGGSCDKQVNPGNDPNKMEEILAGEQFTLKSLAGSVVILIIYNDADQSMEPLESSWPKGLVLEVALDYDGRQFVPDPGLLEQLGITRFVSQTNKFYDRMIENRDSDPNGTIRYRNSKELRFRLPENLIGHTISFRARYQGDGLDLVTTVKIPIRIIPPCDQFDQARIVSSEIYAASEASEYSRAIALADSMLEIGLTYARGWECAIGAAMATHRYNKAATYQKRMWEDFGVTRAEVGRSERAIDGPQYDYGGYRDPALTQEYEYRMEHLRQLQAEEEQKKE